MSAKLEAEHVLFEVNFVKWMNAWDRYSGTSGERSRILGLVAEARVRCFHEACEAAEQATRELDAGNTAEGARLFAVVKARHEAMEALNLLSERIEETPLAAPRRADFDS